MNLLLYRYHADREYYPSVVSDVYIKDALYYRPQNGT